MKIEQNNYWINNYKKDVTNELFNLFLSIKGLIERFYPDEKTEIIANDDLLKMQDNPESIKTVIRQEILPPDDLQWFPIIETSQTTTQSSSSQTQTSQA
jgi:hypothetical protein